MIRDTMILFGRTVKHVTRSADTIITTVMMPIAFMLLFVYVFGGSIKQSLSSNTEYINYLLPGILIMAAAMGTSYVGYRLFEDRTKGMFARVKSMPIKASSFLWAHVLTSLISNLISFVIIIGLAFIMGFRTSAGFTEWLAVIGIYLLLTLALTWLSAIPGILAKTMTGASLLAYPLTFLPMLSSAFVPTETMPAPVRWFAENQPLTSTTNVIRKLFADQALGNEIWVALAWLVGITIVGWIGASQLYKKAV
ncbi:MAG: ABC transporter permease [Streptococcaceae bacterium]|jgi:ABC-2 type transport system permease protein|nr:ABC transporter permease [Streptococcaceae bacterium]